MHDVGSSCSVRGTPCVLKGDRIYVHCGMYGFCVQSIRRGNWYRYANHCSVRCYINFAKSQKENSSRIARYWLPRSKECADLHDVSSSFVRELKRNNKQTNKQTNLCVCVCVCAYSSPPCGRRRAGAYINAHDTFLFKRAIFEMILRQVQLSGELLQRFSVRANNV